APAPRCRASSAPRPAARAARSAPARRQRPRRRSRDRGHPSGRDPIRAPVPFRRMSAVDVRTLPWGWYTDPAVLRLERERIFRRSWQYVGHIGGVPAPALFFATTG